MDMADKMLDDDDIIDLTDLLEEGDTSKKNQGKKEGSARSRSLANEPDSFDLGKEISMEYDVSVEEIEHGGEAVDIDASLSANEEIALTEEKEEASLMPEDTAGGSELDLDEAATKILEEDAIPSDKLDPSPGGSQEDSYGIPDENVEKELEISDVEGAAIEIEEVAAEPDPVKEDLGVFDGEEMILEDPKPAPAGIRSMEIDMAVDAGPFQEEASSGISAEDLAELRQEIPGLVEAVVTPLISELVKEIIAATREQLPGIVEKVIREEIDKLKKLD